MAKKNRSVDPGDVDDWSAIAYEAASDGRAWMRLLAQMVRATGATGGALFTPRDDLRGRRMAYRCGSVTPESFGEYMVHWHRYDPWNLSPAAPRLFDAAGSVRLGQEFIADEDFVRTPYYNEFSLKHGAGGLVSLRVCDQRDPHAPEVHLTLLRPFKDGPFELATRRALRRFWPDLRAAVRAHWSLGPMRHAQAVVGDVLRLLPSPAWVLAADGAVQCMNGAAEAAVRSTPQLAQHGNRLRGLPGLTEDALSHHLRAAATGRGAKLAVRWPAGAPATARLIPVHETHPLREAWPAACALLLLEQAGPREPDALDRVCVRFGLTPRERDVLRLLAEGASVPAIADALHIGKATVRSYLHSLFDKTGCRRQAELVRLALAGIAEAPPGKAAP